MYDSDLDLLECLLTVHSTVPSHEELFREAADHIMYLEDLLEGYIKFARNQQDIVQLYREAEIRAINDSLQEIREQSE